MEGGTYVRHTSHTSQRSARLYSGVNRIDCKTRRRKKKDLQTKLQRAKQAVEQLELEPWLTEIVPLTEVEIAEPEVVVQVDEVQDGADGDGPTIENALPLLRTKFPNASQEDAMLIAPLLKITDSPITVSSEVPLKYFIMPLLFSSNKLLIFVSSSTTRQDAMLYYINTRKHMSGLPKGYGIRWTYRSGSISTYFSFSDISYTYSHERTETIRRELWKNLPWYMVKLIDSGVVVALVISYQDFLSGAFHHFLQLVKTSIHRFILDWFPSLSSLALEKITNQYQHHASVVSIVSAPIFRGLSYAELQLKQVHVSTRAEGRKWLADRNKEIATSAVLCVVEPLASLYGTETTINIEDSLLYVPLQNPLQAQLCEYLSVTTDYEPFDPRQIKVLLLDCIPTSTTFLLRDLSLKYSFPTLTHLTTIIRVVSPGAVVRQVEHLLISNLSRILFGCLALALLNGSYAPSTKSLILSFQRMQQQLMFLSGSNNSNIEERLLIDVVCEAAKYMNLQFTRFSYGSYIYKLFGSLTQAAAERKYPICRWLKQACDLEGTPHSFTMSTFLCLLTEARPAKIPLEYTDVEEYLATLHDTEAQIVCSPQTENSSLCMIYSILERPDINSAIELYTGKILDDLKHSLDALYTEIMTHYSKQIWNDAQSMYNRLAVHVTDSPVANDWKQQFTILRQALGLEYNPIAAALPNISSALADPPDLQVFTLLKITLTQMGDARNPFADALTRALDLVTAFFKFRT